jgi:hypothetical protein
MNPRPTHPHHNLHHSTMVLTRQSILAQSSRVSTRSNYGRQFFALATNGIYSHSSNLHCRIQVRILYSQTLSTPLLHSPDLFSFGISYLSSIFLHFIVSLIFHAESSFEANICECQICYFQVKSCPFDEVQDSSNSNKVQDILP